VIDGVVREGVDGWRLDVADFIPHEFWKDWTARVRALNPQAFLMGECAKPFSPTPSYVHPEGFSSVMSYGFKALLEQFFVSRRLSPSRFDAQLAKLRGAFPEDATHAMYNLLDSHDTERLSSLIVNPDALKLGDARDFGSPELNGLTPDFDTRKPKPAEYRLLELAAIFQMTYPGAPAILYGDEVGMWAAGRNFKPMVWTDLAYASEAYACDAGNAPDGNRKVRNDRVEVVREVHEHFRKLIRLRNAHPALRTGKLETLFADDARELLAYSRRAGDETVVVILNNGSRPRVVELALGSALRELLNGDETYPSREGKVRVPVGAGWGAVLVQQ
jgi:glycosidase